MKVFNLMSDSMDGTEGGATGHAVSKGLTMCGVLLVSVGGGDIAPLLHIMPRAITGQDALDEGAMEGGVGEVKGLAVAAVSGGGKGILPQPAKEEECKGGEVKDGLGMGLIAVMGEAGDEGLEDGDVDQPHLSGDRVFIGPGLEEGLESEDAIDAIQLGIQVAQSGELLAHSMYGFLHMLSSDGLQAAGQETLVVVAGIDDEEAEMGIPWDIKEERILQEGGAW